MRKSMTPRPLRILVIGAGPAAQTMHLPVLARLRSEGHLELAVICDLDAKRAATAQQRFGFREVSADASASIGRDDLDAVYVFGSAQLHHRCGLEALRRGKHLLVEKPISPGYAQAMQLVSEAASRGLVAVGAHNRRFYKSLAAVRARAGKTEWRFAEAVFHKPEFGREPPYGANSWLSANGIHALDALLFMMGGPPTSLQCSVGETSRPARAFSAILRWPNGAQGTFLCNNEAGARREEYAFHGLGDTFRVSERRIAHERDGRTSITRHDWLGDGVEAEHRAFLAAVQEGTAPLHGLDLIAPSLFVAEMIEAGLSGTVKIPALPAPSTTCVSSAMSRLDSIAVTAQPAILAAVAQWLPDMPAISLEEIRRRGESRPDVVAAMLGGASMEEADLDKLPNLRVVGIHGLSLERYRPRALLARGIALINAESAYAESVAEFALALIILGRRRAFASHEAMRHGGWGTRRAPRGAKEVLRRCAGALRPVIRAVGLEPAALRLWNAGTSAAGPAPSVPRDLRGTTVGLIGWGANACALTRRLAEAGAVVLAYSQHASPQDIALAGARAVSLTDCLACEVVSLHRGLTAATRHFLGSAELDRLRPGTLLVNLARGALIEPDALLARLGRGDLFACLDTFDEEPLTPTHPLRTLPNVFLTSHIAGGSKDLPAAAALEVAAKIVRCLKGDASVVISEQRLSTMT